MKTFCFCLLILSFSILQLKAQLDYTHPATTWSASTCTTDEVFQSPTSFMSERCAPYESFSMNLPAVAGVSATWVDTHGAYQIPYTDGTFSVNGRSFTTQLIAFRIPAEHHLPGFDPANSMEVQIALTPTDSTLPGVLSFILYSDGSSFGFKNSRAALDVVTAFGATSTPAVSLALDTLTQKINEKISSGLFLNIFTYKGTQTYPSCDEALWYVYASPLAIADAVLTNAKTALSNQPGSTTLSADGGNNRPIGVTGGGVKNLAAVRLCYTGYFKNYMNYNFGLWFGVVIIVGWFIVNLIMGEKPIKDTDYQETTWTNHPFYSIYHVGNELFTNKTRMGLLLGTVTIHALFSSTWYRRTTEENRTRGSNIIVYAVYSMLVSWVFVYIIGSMLRGYYLAKHQYYKTKDEGWQQKSQNRIFGFYFGVFLCVVVLWPFTVWNMGELHPEKDDKASSYWVASFFVGLALEFLLVDPIICLLAKSMTPLRNLIKNRGYMYDNICHETYLDFLKMD